MRIGPGDTHELDVVLLDAVLELLGVAALVVRPEAVLFDESGSHQDLLRGGDAGEM